MAIIGVTETWEDRGGELRDDYSREAVRTFRVHCDSASHVAQEIYLAPGIPRVRDAYSAGLDNAQKDQKNLCRSVRAEHDQDDPFNWLVTCRYETRDEELGLGAGDEAGGANQDDSGGPPGGPGGGPNGQNGQGTPNTSAPPQRPTLRPPEIEWSFETYQEVADWAYSAVFEGEDVNDHPVPIRNIVGDRFDPPAEKESHRLILKYTRNEASFDVDFFLALQGRTNSRPFLGFERGKVLLNIGPAVRQYEEGFFFWRITYTFKFRDDGWNLKLLNQGAYVKEPHPAIADFEVKTAARRDFKDGHRTGELVLLDLKGHEIPAGEEPVFLEFRVYGTANFDVLKIQLPP